MELRFVAPAASATPATGQAATCFLGTMMTLSEKHMYVFVYLHLANNAYQYSWAAEILFHCDCLHVFATLSIPISCCYRCES